MAKILYALSGANRGHTSRTLAVTEGLRARGHEIVFCCGGKAQEVLEAMGERVLRVPALLQAMLGNRVLYWQTVRQNFAHVHERSSILAGLLPRIEAYAPDLVVSDYESYAPVAAGRLGIPVLTLDHPQIVIRTRYEVPLRFRFEAFATRAVMRRIAPGNAVHGLVTSFFFPPVRDPGRTTLIGPILRRAVREARAEPGARTLVYVNQPEGADGILEVLSRIRAQFVVYNFARPAGESRWGNLLFRGSSLDGFLEDLATCRAVISTAGYTLMTEALWLGKPLLVAPNRGQFEQTLNALYLEREGLGEAVYRRPLDVADVEGFLGRLDSQEPRLPRRGPCGNDAAIGHIERAASGNPLC